jgi:hypothetical protein
MRTPLCDLLGIEAPVICAPFGPWEEVELAAAVCAAGGLGSLGTAAGAARRPPSPGSRSRIRGRNRGGGGRRGAVMGSVGGSGVRAVSAGQGLLGLVSAPAGSGQ